MASTHNPTSIDSLLADLSRVPTAHPTPAAAQSAVKTDNSLDWLLFDSDVLAPHPDAFESELDSIAALGTLDAELAALPTFSTVDSFNPGNFNLYTQYRGANVAHSAYSGYGGGGAPSTYTVSSESLSAYGSAYDSYEKFAAESVAAAAAAHSAQQHTQHLSGNPQPSLASLFPDLDLHLSAFNLTGRPTPTASTAAADTAMLPRLSTIDNDKSSPTSGSRASTSSSPSYDAAADYNSYLIPGPATAGSNGVYTNGHGHGHSGSSMPSVPHNGNSALVSHGNSVRDQSSPESGDPRKKYQCPTCPRAFARAFNLKTHMATHDPNRVKSYMCKHSGCGRSFSRKHDLGRHLVSIHQDTSVIGSSIPPSGASVASGSGSTHGAPRSKVSPSSIGVGGSEKGRVWRCDSCGKGWLAGSREECDCTDRKDFDH